MSEPLRFNPGSRTHDMVLSREGLWVSWDDYRILYDEVELLKKVSSKALTDFWYMHEGYFRLQAELDRLKKEGNKSHG